MSTQTGIKANQELNDFFAKCKEDNSRSKYRMIKVVISNEELSLDISKETSGDWKQDWDKMVLRSIETDEPCYLFYRYVKYFDVFTLHLNLFFQNANVNYLHYLHTFFRST